MSEGDDALARVSPITMVWIILFVALMSSALGVVSYGLTVWLLITFGAV